MLSRLGNGVGLLGLAAVLGDESRLGGAQLYAAEAPGVASAAGTPLSPKSPHFPPRATRVIHLFMNGGPSQVDTFDPKPALEKYAGQAPPAELVNTMRRTKGSLMPSPFKFEKRGQSGIEVSELFPHISRCIDDLCVIRSMHTNLPNHEPSFLMMNSGETQPTRPSLGSWLTYGLGSENQNLPGYVVLCPGQPTVGPQLWSNSFLPGIYQGVHINNAELDPKTVIKHLTNNHVSPTDQRRQLDLLRKLNESHLARRARDAQLEARIEALEMAFRMQTQAQEAFDIGRESAETRKLYGDGEFANACLIARRLAERGVRITQVYFGGGQPWDDHADIANHRQHAQKSDQAIAGLLTDLKSRGLLEDTLVVWGGEFGRTPTAEGSKGRDHNNLGFSMWLAGGGVKGGHVHGTTDEMGFSAVEGKVHVHDLHATILHLLGIDHTKLTYRYSGRDFRLTDVHGEVVREILA
ncbi:MAG: DUF1501 domain-containing protein [Planctomycetaceae bacterium]|nr:DUF1501 domain-containing protein [Planctomycetaceae bacterium]